MISTEGKKREWKLVMLGDQDFRQFGQDDLIENEIGIKT